MRSAVVMGVAGSGKTTVGKRLADALGWRFVEGDEHHPAANIAKMSRGVPLEDADRWPWLDAVGAALREHSGAGGVVASCSALKRAYRERLAAAAEAPLRFVLLHAPEETLAARMAARSGHFMAPTLLASQLATLEWPAPDEDVVIVSVARHVDDVLEDCLWAIRD